MRKIKLVFLGIALMAFVNLNCVNSKEKMAKSTSDSETQYYLDLGKSVSSGTQAVLGKNLMGALGKGGPEYALGFCNSKAIPLTDSMALVLKTSIKRVSDQARNPGNKANAFEESIIKTQKAQLKKGEPALPVIKEIKGKMMAYYPIVTNGMCLQCHGKANQSVNQKTFDKIKDYYPKDEAMGYDVNQLRGLWVVEIQKTKK